jgi:3'-phosphoadenosine 5'-phosphosulfate sulfotransferase
MPILKIDTLIQEDYEFVNGPGGNLKIRKIVDLISQRFDTPIIQTMFFKVKTKDKNFDNTREESLEKYFEALLQIKPSEVMIYSVSRDTPMSGIEKCDIDTLNKIASRIESFGIKTLVTP